jgi:molybdopterin-guanine dinucleotide biosynthesis protein A
MDEEKIISDITAVILAGGSSTRMKSNKALLPYRGERFIERIHRRMASIFSEVTVVTNTPELYHFLPCRTVPDIYPCKCSLAGIHAGLTHCRTPYIFVVGCDMPDLNKALVRHLISGAGESDVIIPESRDGLEPLHSVYGKGCLPAIQRNLSAGRSKITDCFDGLKVTVVPCEEVAVLDPLFLSFRNINTPDEYFRMRRENRETVPVDEDETSTDSR